MKGLLDGLREAGAQDQVTALAERIAKYVALDDPAGAAGRLHRGPRHRQAGGSTGTATDN